MSEPRFQVGQMVVIHGLRRNAHLNGHVGTIAYVDFRRWHSPDRQHPIYFGWAYWLDNHPQPEDRCWLGEYALRPYDPPASWDDSVWVPEALRTPEEEEI